MYNKNDPLVNSVKSIMEQNDLRRRVEAQLCEELGIYSRKALPREHHSNYDTLLEQRIKEALVGNQHKIDANKNNRVDAHDFKLLRAKKEMQEQDDGEETREGGAVKYDGKTVVSPTATRAGESSARRPATEGPSATQRQALTNKIKDIMKEDQLDELSLDKMNAAKKEATKRKEMADKGDSPVDKKYAKRYGKYVELATRRMKSKMDEENLEEKATPAQQEKVGKVMGEFKRGELHSGSKEGPEVTSPKQAIAIALSKAGISKKKIEEDFDLDAVMEEIRNNLGEEAFNEMMEQNGVLGRDINAEINDNRTAMQMAMRPQSATRPQSAVSALSAARQTPTLNLGQGERRFFQSDRAPTRDNASRLFPDQRPSATQTQGQRQPPANATSGSPFGSLTRPNPNAPSSSTPSMVASGPNLSSSNFRGNTPSISVKDALGDTGNKTLASYSPVKSTGFSTDKPAPSTSSARPASSAAPSPAARPAATNTSAAPAAKEQNPYEKYGANDADSSSASFFRADQEARARGMFKESKSLTSTINKILKG